MTTYEIIRTVVWIVGIPIIIFLILNITRRVQAIRTLDKQLRDEEAQTATNPYADMARMYEEQEQVDKKRK